MLTLKLSSLIKNGNGDLKNTCDISSFHHDLSIIWLQVATSISTKIEMNDLKNLRVSNNP